MSFIRPYLPVAYTDAWQNNIAQQINNNNIIAGNGIKVIQTSNGQRIDLDAGTLHGKERMVYRGVFNTQISYFPGDVVFVDPLLTYTQNGENLTFDSNISGSRAPIAGGLFICNYPISTAEMTIDVLVNLVGPAIEGGGGIINEDNANLYRNYDQNNYYPMYPMIPTSSFVYTDVSGYNSFANYNFWSPLSPMFKSQVCIDGSTTVCFINGSISGSVFDMTKLPYIV